MSSDADWPSGIPDGLRWHLSFHQTRGQIRASQLLGDERGEYSLVISFLGNLFGIIILLMIFALLFVMVNCYHFGWVAFCCINWYVWHDHWGFTLDLLIYSFSSVQHSAPVCLLSLSWWFWSCLTLPQLLSLQRPCLFLVRMTTRWINFVYRSVTFEH